MDDQFYLYQPYITKNKITLINVLILSQLRRIINHSFGIGSKQLMREDKNVSKNDRGSKE